MVTPTHQEIHALETSGHFDAEWYRQVNGDVDALLIDPALHYLIYGHRMGRDPGPTFSTAFTRTAWRLDEAQEPLAWLAKAKAARKSGQPPAPHRAKVLAGAAAVARQGDHERAVALARQYLPGDLAYTAEILRANMATRQDDDAAWLRHINRYLGHFGVAPIQLSPASGSRFARLQPSALPQVTGGPLVSVIMPAWNAATTIEHAAGSILGQSWRNLELLIVDDCSDDDTWAVIQRIAAGDDRVRAIRNRVNVGPYVSKNIALGLARGAWVTGHDADDWALPDRIERHIRTTQQRGLRASVTDMLRIHENGQITHLNGISSFCFDGVARRASISCLFEAETLRHRLGAWDSVRYGGDSEMIARVEALLGDEFAPVHDIGMICLNHEASLTNSATAGVQTVGMSPSRVAYKNCWKDLYVAGMDPALAYLPFPQQTRRHDAMADMVVPLKDILANLDEHAAQKGGDIPAPVPLPQTRPAEPAPEPAPAPAPEPVQTETAKQQPQAEAPAQAAPAPAPEPAQSEAAAPAETHDATPGLSMAERLERFRFRRADGKPFRILARGDCTSFRSVHLNKDLFPDGVEFIQAQKSPFVMLNEAANGLTVTHDELNKLSDTSLMPGSLSRHYLGQADREILTAADADLVMLDSWADMNFELWRSRENGWTVWTHPKYLRDPEGFRASHEKIGRQTLEQSLEQAEKLVAFLRTTNPGIPVLLLNQQTDYYPKMDIRREYYTLGEKLAERIPDAWFGGVTPKDDLETADVGSCGPGNTLHFQAQTYRRMVMNALEAGMIDRFDPVAEAQPAPPAPGKAAEKSAEAQPQQAPKDAAATDDVSANTPRFASDNPEQIAYPMRQVEIPDDAAEALANYIMTAPDAGPTRWTPAVIEVTPGSYAEWERAVNKRYSRVRMKRRSEKAGHIVDLFNPRLHIPDMHEIHHSAAERSGGQMRGNYLKSIDEMGGAPTMHHAPVQPTDPHSWTQCIGVFKTLPGHVQGSVTVDRQLICYISFRRMGDILLYSQLMGHDAHLADGVMYHAHFHVIQQAMDSGDPLYDGLRFVMYGGVGNGGKGLWQWKRTAGFTPMQLATFPCSESVEGDAIDRD